MKKIFSLNLLLTIIAVVFSLIVVELFLRFYVPVTYRQPPKLLPNNVWRELLHRPSQVPGLAYELAPNREKHSHGAIIRTNSYGMRDDEPLPKNDASVGRIAVLGDSFTFGFGVPGDHTYPNVLERLLDKRVDGRRFEVLNFGVGGYSTYDEALVFKHKAISWDLDLVIIGYVFNDPEFDPIQPLHLYYQKVSWWQHSNLLRFIAKLKLGWDILIHGEGNYIRYLHATNRQKWQSVVTSLEDIKNVATESNIPVLLVIFPAIKDRSWGDYPHKDLHKQIADTAKEKGIYVVDLFANFSKYRGQELMASPRDGHPNKIGYEVAAHAILQWILMNKEEVIVSRIDNSEH